MTLLIYVLLTVRALASDDSTAPETIPQRPYVSLSTLLSLPLRDFICSPQYIKRRKLYKQAIVSRPEFESIDWQESDCSKLARQIWALQLDESDNSYHKGLYAAIKMLLKYHKVPQERADRVQAIISEKSRLRGSRVFNKYESERTRPTEYTEARRLRKNSVTRVRKAEQKNGRNLPLLDYICIEDPQNVEPKVLHELALRYRHMYRSPLSFIKCLRNMWKALGYNDDEVYQQNNDARNYHQAAFEAGSSSEDQHNNAQWDSALLSISRQGHHQGGMTPDNNPQIDLREGGLREKTTLAEYHCASGSLASQTHVMFEGMQLEDLPTPYHYPQGLLPEEDGQMLPYLEPLPMDAYSGEPQHSAQLDDDESRTDDHQNMQALDLEDDLDFHYWDYLP